MGKSQGVALARALAPEPGLLLLDEPFGALDTRLRKELRSWLKELHQRIKLTTLLVTHDQEEAFELSDRILVMNKGVVEQDAAPPQVFNHPATEFVAQFVGETNRVEGIIENGMAKWGPFKFSARSLKDGARVSILFRPNDVYVTSRFEEGEAPGRIRSIQFMGATESIDIQLSNGLFVTAHVPKGVAKQSGFIIGKQVYVAITTVHLFEVPAENFPGPLSKTLQTAPFT